MLHERIDHPYRRIVLTCARLPGRSIRERTKSLELRSFLGNCLQQALRKIGKENIVHNCVFNIEWVTDDAEKRLAKARLTSRGGSADGVGVHGARRVSAHCPMDERAFRHRLVVLVG